MSHALSEMPPSPAPPLLEPLPLPETPPLLELPAPLEPPLDPLPELDDDVASSPPPEEPDPELPEEEMEPPLLDDEHPATATTTDPETTVRPAKASAMEKGASGIFMGGLVRGGRSKGRARGRGWPFCGLPAAPPLTRDAAVAAGFDAPGQGRRAAVWEGAHFSLRTSPTAGASSFETPSTETVMRSTLLQALAFSTLAFVPACSAASGADSPHDTPQGDDAGPTPAPGDDGGPADDGHSDAPSDGGPTPLPEPGYLKTVAQSSFVTATDFGSPYDSILAAPMQSLQSAIAPGYKTKPAAGQVSSTYTFQEVDSSQDLYSALNVSASLSVTSGLFSGSAKMSFAQSQHIDSTKLTILVDGTSVGLATQIADPQLTASAAALSPADFYAAYGDRYAAEIITGVELFGTLEIETRSEQDKRDLAASLSLSYGPSNLSGSYSSTFQSAVSGRNVSMHVQAIGFPTPTFNDTASFLNAVASFGTSYNVDAGANTNSQALQIIYSSYYGIPGYPGVPAGTDTKVSQHAQAVSQYMLYNSLVSQDFAAYYADQNYATSPFLTGMKSYRDALDSYLTSSLQNSQALPALPSPAAAGKIETFTTTATTHTPNGPNSSPQFILHTLDNGFVPKRLSDYEIPLRYVHDDDSLKGANFAAISPMIGSQSQSASSPLVYQLYPVDKTVYPQPQNRVVSYQWDTGTYMFPGVFDSNGQPDPAKITSAIVTLNMADMWWTGAGSTPTHFVLANKATGLVMTDNGGGGKTLTVDHLAAPGSSTSSQIWTFQLQGCNRGGTTWQGSTQAVYIASTMNTGWVDVNNQNTNPGTPLDTWGWLCSDNQTFFFNPKDGGSTVAISGYGGFGGEYISASGVSPAAQVVNQPLTPADSQLWVFIPFENIDQNP